MEEIILGSDMKKVDSYTINRLGVPSLVLMERAALGVYEEVIGLCGKDARILIVCGVGNNGADGIALSRMLKIAGYTVDVHIVDGLDKGTEEFHKQLQIIANIQVNKVEQFDVKEYNVIIDAIFGLGLNKEVRGRFYNCIDAVNSSKAVKIAVDIPSGLCSNTGKILGIAVKADYTVTFGRKKAGLVINDGPDYTGRLITKEIGFPDAAYGGINKYFAYERKDISLLPKRRENSNKGTYGKLLVIAGEKNMSGAAFLVSKAAYRTGVGLVRIFSVEDNREILQTLIPEAVLTTYVPEADNIHLLESVIRHADAIVAGPGLGTEPAAEILVKHALLSKKKIVLDADALNIIANNEELTGLYHSGVIITPHIGEMSRLTGLSAGEVKDNIIPVCSDYASKHGITCVLKDAKSVICNGSEIFINILGNSGMAVAGSGDVLAGIIGGLLASGFPTDKAGAFGACLHGLAGDIIADKTGKNALMATDIIEGLLSVSREEM